MTSDLEQTLYLHLLAAGFPEPVREYRFIQERKFRADFAWPDKRILVECEGGVWSNGRHTRGEGYTNDCVKYNLAQLHGWRVFRFTRDMIDSGAAIITLRSAWSDE